ncbi:MAG: tetratricopeptide repeat protein [Candidatus Thorarchaeota archaeon]|nr:MAG: tetratricopeptide repeat protein [Candidatus Thorarchaeota archaeon]
MDDIGVLTKPFVGRKDWLQWMNDSIQSSKIESIGCHIYGVGGIGKSSLLRYWAKNIQHSILIDCSISRDFNSRINQIAIQVRKLGYVLPRFDLLWSIKQRLLDGVEPSADEPKGWLKDIIAMVPLLGDFVDKSIKFGSFAKKLREIITKKKGKIGNWFEQKIGANWDNELIEIIWKDPNKTILLLLQALESDIDENTSSRDFPLIFLFDAYESINRHDQRWKIGNFQISEGELWHKFGKSIQRCILVTSGRTQYNEDWCKWIDLEQIELKALHQNEAIDLLTLQKIADVNIQNAIISTSRCHPFLLQLLCDLHLRNPISIEIISNLESNELEKVRAMVWNVLYHRAKHISKLIDIAAILPYFNKEILSVVYPEVKSSEWLDLISYSFVKQRKEDEFALHELAKEMSLAEIGDNKKKFVDGIGKNLNEGYQRTEKPALLGLQISILEHVSQDVAIKYLPYLTAGLRIRHKFHDILSVFQSVEFRSERCIAYHQSQLGEIYSKIDRLMEAEQNLLSAFETQKRLVSENECAILPEFASTMNLLGIFYTETGRPNEAEKMLTESLNIWHHIEEDKENERLSNIAMCLFNLGNLLDIKGKPEESLKRFTEALIIFRKLVKSGQEEYIPDLANTLNSLGILNFHIGNYKKCEEMYNEALEICRKLSELHSYYNADVASTLVNLGNFFAQTGRHIEALPSFDEATEIYRTLAEITPETYLSDVAMVLQNTGHLLTKTGNNEDAERMLIESLEIYNNLAQESPSKYNPFLAAAYNNLGILLRRTNRLGDAEQAMLTSLDLNQELAKLAPDLYLQDYAKCLIGMGRIYTEKEEYDKAEHTVKQGLQIFESLLQNNDQSTIFEYSSMFNNLGGLYFRTQQYEEARKAFERCLDIRRQLSMDFDPSFDYHLARTLLNLVKVYQELNLLPDADKSLEEGLLLLKRYSQRGNTILIDTIQLLFSTMMEVYTEVRGLSEADAKSMIKKYIQELTIIIPMFDEKVTN